MKKSSRKVRSRRVKSKSRRANKIYLRRSNGGGYTLYQCRKYNGRRSDVYIVYTKLNYTEVLEWFKINYPSRGYVYDVRYLPMITDNTVNILTNISI